MSVPAWCSICWLLVLCPPAAASEPFAPRLYAVTIETGLPHLEENLRYATQRSTLCLGENQLAFAFPVLRHPALDGCRLERSHGAADSLSFGLICRGGAGTTGGARWEVDAGHIRGVLEVKLGGKNMTFYQRIDGRVVGGCAARPG